MRGDVTEHQWVVREQGFSAGSCSAIEGGIQPGMRRLLRFTVTTANIGNADLYIGDPRSHYAANDGLFEFASCHHHFHFRNYALYELVDPATGKVWRASKQGFCMLDSDPNPAYLGGEPPRRPKYSLCGSPTEAGDQGISHGWSDTYRFFLAGQFFVLDGGDGQAPVPAGEYVIRITANPPFQPSNGEPCPVTDSRGFCHMFAEANYFNNVAQIPITIPEHLGRDGHGPLAGVRIPEDQPEH